MSVVQLNQGVLSYIEKHFFRSAEIFRRKGSEPIFNFVCGRACIMSNWWFRHFAFSTCLYLVFQNMKTHASTLNEERMPRIAFEMAKMRDPGSNAELHGRLWRYLCVLAYFQPTSKIQNTVLYILVSLTAAGYLQIKSAVICRRQIKYSQSSTKACNKHIPDDDVSIHT